MLSDIYILSQPIQSGKTTLLQRWLKDQSNVAGIITPDVNGRRKLFDIASRQYSALQLQDDSEGLRIGRFVFDPEVFAEARQILTKASLGSYDWIVVDEIGRLEINQHKGLEPAVTAIINHFKTSSSETKLLLVIRDYLLEEALAHYDIVGAQMISLDFFDSSPTMDLKPPVGIVLCGGQSVRMGRDKAFIVYHQLPQYAYVAEMMKGCCDQVYISCKPNQSIQISQQHNILLDNATFENAGPMTGLLSVLNQLPSTALLVMGCDYPMFTEADMKSLIDARSTDFDCVCYHNSDSGFDEPLLAVYEKQCASLLLEFYQNGNTSLQQFLKTIRTKRIFPVQIDHILSKDVS